MLNIDKSWVLGPKICLSRFSQSCCALIPFPSVSSLGLLSQSFCIENAGNSEKNSYMAGATSHIELENFIKLLDTIPKSTTFVSKAAVTVFLKNSWQITQG